MASELAEQFAADRQVTDAIDLAIRREIWSRLLRREWITAHEANLSGISYSAFETGFLWRKRLKPFALSAALKAREKSS